MMELLLLLAVCFSSHLSLTTSFSFPPLSFHETNNRNDVDSVLRNHADADVENCDDKTKTRESDSSEHVSKTLWESLAQNFQGDFDNYEQVLEDRRNGRLPREGGGHEHIHCTIVPLGTLSARLAAFYFDGAPQRIFRFRYYELQQPSPVCSESIPAINVGGTAATQQPQQQQIRMEMRLYTLNPKLEGLLRSKPENPEKWSSMFESFAKTNPSAPAVYILPNCEVSWSLDIDTVQHSYLASQSSQSPKEPGVHAVMVHGEAIVDSTMIQGIKIRVLDQLSLFPDTFYINDRGLDPETGAYVYGNQRNIPYRLDRVTHFVQNTESTQQNTMQQRRSVVNTDLEWTLGDTFRTDQLYEEKMVAIGGPSARLSTKK